jgi:protein-L-isoaspartate(D-aspartate) O-methyltransferase
MDKDDLMNRLEFDTQVFKNKAIKEAFQVIDRKDFIHADYEFEAYEDYAVPTIAGQSISQPTTVAFMLELLDVQEGDTVLDIGSGSGWTTALLGHMVGKDGKVIGLEIIPELVAHGKENIAKYKKLKLPIEILQADKEAGLYKHGPYDRILCSAEFSNNETVPIELLLQLVPGGVMVVPVNSAIVKYEKVTDDEVYETEYPGFSFVPYIE